MRRHLYSTARFEDKLKQRRYALEKWDGGVRLDNRTVAAKRPDGYWPSDVGQVLYGGVPVRHLDHGIARYTPESSEASPLSATDHPADNLGLMHLQDGMNLVILNLKALALGVGCLGVDEVEIVGHRSSVAIRFSFSRSTGSASLDRTSDAAASRSATFIVKARCAASSRITSHSRTRHSSHKINTSGSDAVHRRRHGRHV
jgi:hypothetical protein